MIKILIVEDEAGIRNSLAKAFPWREMGCELMEAADSGISALAMCMKNQPDIIISDIVMPGVDGLTFLRYVREQYPETQFIILTGHRSFDYARDAINLGASFFLTKPIVYSELLDAINKLIEKIYSQQENKRILNQREQVLRYLLTGKIYKSTEIVPQVKSFLDSLDRFQVVVFRFDYEMGDLVRQQNLQTYLETLITGQSVTLTRVDDQNLAMVVKSDTQHSDNDSLRQFLNQVLARATDTFRASLSLGVSLVHDRIDQLHEAYVESLRALGRKFFSGNGSINFFISDVNGSLDKNHQDFKTINRICDQVVEWLDRADNSTLSLDCNQLFKETLLQLGDQIDLIKSVSISAIILIIKRVLKDDTRQIGLMFDKYASFRKIVSCESLDELNDVFNGLIMDLADYRSIKSLSRQTLMNRIVNYIQKNYHNGITLNDIAKQVYLSPTYLSSIISNETGKGFSDLLNEVRIQKAIELLSDPKKKITEIAYAVGYNEPQYFTMTFKKYTDMTPRDYREMLLKA
jgi:YesN/AraC family two-component response regulator